MRANTLGINYGAVGLGLGLMTWLSTNALGADESISFAVAAIFGGTLAAFLDLRFRTRCEPHEGGIRFVHPQRGGHWMFVPVWLMGSCAIVAGAVSFATRSTDDPQLSGRIEAVAEMTAPMGAAHTTEPAEDVTAAAPTTPAPSPFRVAEVIVQKRRLVIGDWKSVSDLAFGDPFYVMVVATWCPHSKAVLSKLDSLVASEKPWDIYEIDKEEVNTAVDNATAPRGPLTRAEAQDQKALYRRTMSHRILSAVLVYETEYDDLISMLLTNEMVADAKQLQSVPKSRRSFVFDSDMIMNARYPYYTLPKGELHDVVHSFPTFLRCERGLCSSLDEEGLTCPTGGAL